MSPISRGSSDVSPERVLLDGLKPMAVDAANNAYAPYSGFRVGAAVMAKDGAAYSGCNVENASYGLTQCAERNAIHYAIAQGVQKGSIQGLLIYVPGDRIHSPCGGCRQVMMEMMNYDALVLSCCDARKIKVWDLHELMPDPFEFE